MSSIALFPCSFTPAAALAVALAKDLELTVYDDQELFADASKRCGRSIEELKKCAYGRTSVFNQFTLEKEISVNMLKFVVAELLIRPEAYLFNGFLASLVPANVAHVLRVLIVDSRQARIEAAIKQGMSKKEAKKAVKNDDVRAYGWTDFLFKKEAYHNSLYDMVIPVENRSEAQLINVISKGYHKTSVLRTKESMQAAQDMKLEVAVEQKLLWNGHKVTVSSKAGRVDLAVQKSVLNFGRLMEELTDLAMQVDGVKQVSVVKSSAYDDSIYRQQKFELPSKVLFVDDEIEFVQTVSQRLISRNVGTYGVFSGEEALELIAEDRPEVMVLDLKMPGLHGVEVLRKTRELAPEVEVIILTGHGTNQDMLQCMELGAFAYMNKPVDIEELSATIKAANDKAHARAQG